MLFYHQSWDYSENQKSIYIRIEWCCTLYKSTRTGQSLRISGWKSVSSIVGVFLMRLRATCFGKESIQNSCKRSLSKTFLTHTSSPALQPWHPQRKAPLLLKYALQHLSLSFRRSRERTSIIMPKPWAVSRCSAAARPSATGTAGSYRLPRSRRERTRRSQGEYSLTGGGLVRLLSTSLYLRS